MTQDRIEAAFPPRVLDRLRLLKAKYDPDNVFRDNFNIAPSPIVALGAPADGALAATAAPVKGPSHA